MPSSYVDIDRDEMEYVDGGWSVHKRFRNKIGIDGLAAGSAIAIVMSLSYTFGAILSAATGVGAAAMGIVAGYAGYLAVQGWEAHRDASYYYKKYGTYYITISGFGPFVTGIRADQ